MREMEQIAAKWPPARGAVRSRPFSLLRVCCPERPGAIEGAPLLGAAERTIDGEDRSEMIAGEGKAGAKDWRKVSAMLVRSPAASNTFSPYSPLRVLEQIEPHHTDQASPET